MAFTTVPYDDVFLCADGPPIPVQYVFSPLLDDGRVVGSVVCFTDMRERRLLEEQLRKAHRLEAMGNLVGHIAHSFRNSLQVIVGSVPLLEHGILQLGLHQRGPLLRHVRLIGGAADQASGVIRGLLASASPQGTIPEMVDLSRIVTEKQHFVRGQLGAGVSWRSTPWTGPLLVMADVNHLVDVLMNLSANGSQAMPEGELTILLGRVEPEEAARWKLSQRAWAMLAVADTGTGIDPCVLDRILDPYFTTKSGGTGLGLYSVHAVVEQSGGFVHVESAVARGRLSVFSCRWRPIGAPG